MAAVVALVALAAGALFLPVGVVLYVIATTVCSLWPKPDDYRPDTSAARAAETCRALGANLRRPWGARVGFGDPGEAVESTKSLWPPTRLSAWWGAVAGAGAAWGTSIAWRAASEALAAAEIRWRPGGLRLPALTGVAVFLASQAGAATRRATRHESEAAPAVRLHRAALAASLRRPVVIASVLVSGAVGTGAGWWLAETLGWPSSATPATLAVPAALATFSVLYGAAELAEWRAMVRARDEWHERWLAVPRLGVPPPIFVVAHRLPKEAPTHEVVTFQIPPGADFASYDRHGPHLAAALGSDTVLVAAMASYDEGGRPIPGSQQSLGFQVVHAVVALGRAPHLRAGLDSFTRRFVIRHAFKEAFTALKLGAPELAAVSSLAAGEDQLLLETQWKLGPGVVAEDVMGKSKAVAEKIGAPWVSVGRRSTGVGPDEHHSEFVSVVFGDRPQQVRLAAPVEATQRFLDRIRWDGWFWSCGLRGAGGQTPRFLGSRPAHQGLLVSEFAATEGLPWESVEKATPALVPTVGQAYVEVEASDEAGGFRIVTGAVDPLDRPYLFMDHADELLRPPGDRPDVTFFVGVGVDGKPVLFDHEHEQPHVVVAGASGMGKSTLIHSMLVQLATKNTPDQWELWIAEPKNELQRYKRLPHVRRFIDLSTRGFESHYEALAAMLGELDVEMERRYALFDTLPGRPKKLSAARGLTEERLPYLTCLIEEAADFFFEPALKQVNGDAWKAVVYLADKLARKARGAGIYLVFATQRPTKVSIPPNIKGQSRRIGFGCSTLVDSMVVIDQPGLETIRTRGRGMISGIKGYRGFRAYWLRQPDEENPEEPDDIEDILQTMELLDEDRHLAPGGASASVAGPPAIPAGIWGD